MVFICEFKITLTKYQFLADVAGCNLINEKPTNNLETHLTEKRSVSVDFYTANVYRQRTDKLLFLYAIITHEIV